MKCTRKVPLDCIQWDGSFEVGQQIVELMGQVGQSTLPNPFTVGKHDMVSGDWVVKENESVDGYSNGDFTDLFMVIF
jgi:hypothetical protein